MSFVVGSASEDILEYPTEGQYPTTTPSGNNPIDHIDTITTLRQQRFKLLCAAVIEPLSSA